MATSLKRDAEGAARAFGAYLRSQRQLAELSLKQLADLSRISKPYLSQIERGVHVPSVTMIRALAEALNVSAEVLFTEAAGLERVNGVRPASTGVESAIRNDDHLSQAQKGALLSVYRTMVETRA
jgi:transcriptional regulator with XRE-family HTH domain